MINLIDVTWQEFLLRTLTLHWLTATLVVVLVALLIAALGNLNATTRHTIWLLTLLCLTLMPLLVFAPRPDITWPRIGDSLPLELPTPSEPEAANSQTVDSRRFEVTELKGSDVVAEDRAYYRSEVSASTADGARGTSGQPYITMATLIKAIFVFWLTGVAFLLRRLWGEYRAARELELQSDSVTPYFDRRFDQLCARLGIEERPFLRFHAGISAPMTVGLLRVWVAIPMTWRETIDDSVFDQTLTHELGHIARKDPVIHTVQRLLNVVFWMYPAVWYVSRQLEVERESACDDWVLTHDGKSATYATNLLDVAESLYLQPQVLAVGCLRSSSQLSRRIQNLLNKSSDHKLHNSWALLSLTSLGLLATLSVSAVMWPDAREFSPALAEALEIEPVAEFPVRPLDDLDVVAVQAVPAPASQIPLSNVKPVSEAVAERFEPASPVVSLSVERPPAVSTRPTAVSRPAQPEPNGGALSVMEDESGKLFIKRYGGKIKVFAEPDISPSDELLYAAWKGDTSRLKKLISDNAQDPNRVFARSILPRTALEAAILKNRKTTIDALLALNVELTYDANATDRLSPLTVAAMTGRYAIAKELLKHGAEPDKQTLETTTRNRDARLLDLFLSRVKCDCLDKEEALLTVIDNQDAKSLDVLLKHGVDIDQHAMLLAVKGNNTKTVKKMLKHYQGVVDSSLLTLAIQRRNSGVIDLLISAGVEPDASAVTLAVQQRDSLLVKTLLKHGSQAQEGALVLAIQQRDAEMVEALMNVEAPIGDGALVMALQQGDVKTVYRLLKRQADIPSGALVIAIQQQDIEMVRMLLDAGAEIEDGALIIAEQSRSEAIRTLVKKKSGRTKSELKSVLLGPFKDVGDYEANYQASVHSDANVYERVRNTRRNTNVSSNVNKNKNKNKNANAHGDFHLSNWPVESEGIVLGFDGVSPNKNEQHKALDILAQDGSPVYAVAAGRVKESRYSDSYGHFVVIDHGNGYKTKYANNKNNSVQKGDYVHAHQEIARVGSSGRDSFRPHLHFELRLYGNHINPQPLFSSAQ